MMKHLLLITACWLAWLLPPAAEAAPLIEVDSQAMALALPPYIDILEDSTGSLTIDDVVSERHALQFAPASMTELFFGYTHSVYWVRFTVENQLDDDMRFILETAPADIDFIDLYEIDPHTGNLRSHQQAGSTLAFSERSYQYPLYLFDLDIEAHTAYTYFVRAKSDKTINLQLFMSTPAEYLQRATVRDRWQGFTLGALLIATILHLGLFLQFRFKGFLWYGLFLAAVLLIQTSWNGYLLQFFDPHETLLDRQLLSPVYLSVMFCSLFTQSLLRTRKRVMWQHRLLDVVAILALIGTVATWFVPPYQNSLAASLLALFSILLIFGATLHANMEGDAMARHFLLARTLTTGVILVAIFNIHGYLPQGAFTAWGIAVAIVLEAAVMAISMTHCCLANLRAQFSAHQSAAPQAVQRPLVNLADICHELRTPISGVMGMADLLLAGNLSEQQRNQLKTIQKSGHALLEVTNKLSDLSVIEGGSIELSLTPFELTSVTETCIENCRGRAEFNNIELIYHVDSKLTGFVKGDQEKLQQIIINLLQFALRHVEQGEVVLTVVPGADKQVVFTIRSGHNALLDRSSVPDNREPGSSDQLNLTIAGQYIKLMGGELSLQSFADGGVSVHFSAQLEPQYRGTPLQHDDNMILVGRRLLIVDDNATCCSIIEQQAAQWGMHVQSAHGAKEALAILRSSTTVGELFDIALIDYDMPGINGLELAAHIRDDANINSSRLLLIMLTGVSKAPSKIMSESAAIQRVLYKPLSGKSLKQALQTAMAQHLQNHV